MYYYRTRKLRMKNDEFYICLPLRLLRALGWKRGEDLLIWRSGDHDLCIRAAKHEAPKLCEAVSLPPDGGCDLFQP